MTPETLRERAQIEVSLNDSFGCFITNVFIDYPYQPDIVIYEGRYFINQYRHNYREATVATGDSLRSLKTQTEGK